jgi:hypothetical protein
MNTELMLAESLHVKQNADALLQESELISHLQNYGEVLIAGSYSINLMINRDIDLYVIHPEVSQERVLDVLHTLILQGFFHGYVYYDFIKHRNADFPNGYYVGLKMPFRDEKWKVDIWFLAADRPNRLQQIQEVSALDDSKKLAILRFKHLVIERGLNVPSMAIYNIVLRQDITDEQVFLREIAQD